MFINGLFQNYNFPKLYRGSEGPTFPWGSQMLISIETQRSSDFFFFFGGGGGGVILLRLLLKTLLNLGSSSLMQVKIISVCSPTR